MIPKNLLISGIATRHRRLAPLPPTVTSGWNPTTSERQDGRYSAGVDRCRGRRPPGRSRHQLEPEPHPHLVVQRAYRPRATNGTLKGSHFWWLPFLLVLGPVLGQRAAPASMQLETVVLHARGTSHAVRIVRACQVSIAKVGGRGGLMNTASVRVRPSSSEGIGSWLSLTMSRRSGRAGSIRMIAHLRPLR